MPNTTIISQKNFERYQLEHMRLSYMLRGRKMYAGRKLEKFFFYEINDHEYVTKDGPAMLTVAKFENAYILLAPDYLTEKQKEIYAIFVNETSPIDLICVATWDELDIIKKTDKGKNIEVRVVL